MRSNQKQRLTERCFWCFGKALTYGEPERDRDRTSDSILSDLELVRPLFEMFEDKKKQEVEPTIPQWKYNLKNQHPDSV